MTEEERAYAKAHIQSAQLHLSEALVWLEVDPAMSRISTSSASTELQNANMLLPEPMRHTYPDT